LSIAPSLNYKFHENDLSLRYFYIPRTRSSDGTDAARETRSLNGFGLRFSRRWNRRLRTRLGYQFSHEAFLRTSEKDSDIHKVRGDIRYRFHKLFTPGIGFELSFRRSGAGRSYNQGGPFLLVGSRITKALRADLRYRYRFRDYSTDDPSSSNFGREDNKHDVRLRARYKLTDNWLPFLYFRYKNSDSTRTTRTYDTTEVGLGTSFRFPLLLPVAAASQRRTGQFTLGVDIGLQAETADATAFALGLSGDYFITHNFSVGPLFQFGFSDDLFQIGPTIQAKYTFDLPANPKLKLHLQGGIGFIYAELPNSNDTSFLIPLGFGGEYRLNQQISIGSTVLFNITNLDDVRNENFFFTWLTGVRFRFHLHR